MKLKYWLIAGLIVVVALGVSALWAGWKEYQAYKAQRAVIEEQHEIQDMLEKETEILGKERDALLKEKFANLQSLTSLRAERDAINRRLNELEANNSAINIPSTSDGLTEFWEKRGFRPMLRPK